MKRLFIFLILLTLYSQLFSDWTNEQKVTSSDADSLDSFGYAVSVSGDYAVIGAFRDDDAGPGSGSAYIFHFDGTAWVEQHKLTASDAESTDWFGSAVNIYDDTVIVGVDYDDDAGLFSGSAYFFTNQDTLWSEQKITASDAEAYSRFGVSVCIWEDLAVIGAPYHQTAGAVYVFAKEDTVWTEQEILFASDGTSGDYFGHSVSIFGEDIVVGAPYDGEDDEYTGSAYVFHRTEDSWIEIAKLSAFDGEPEDMFGYAVSVFNDKLLVSAFKDDNIYLNSGSVYTYELAQDICSFQQKLSPSDSSAEDRFGFSLSLSEGNALIGSYWDNVNGAFSGSAYIFSFESGEWIQEQKLSASDSSEEDVFGCSVSLSGDNALIGAYRADETGAAYFYNNDGLDFNNHSIPILQMHLTNSPNPFNPSTKISFSLPPEFTENAEIIIFNTKGQKVKTFSFDTHPEFVEGFVIWNGKDDNGKTLSTGMYFCKLSTGSKHLTRKMILLK
jgi:hypothetical protein